MKPQSSTTVTLQDQNIELGIFDIWYALKFNAYQAADGTLGYDFFEHPTLDIKLIGLSGDRIPIEVEDIGLQVREFITEHIESRAMAWTESNAEKLNWTEVDEDDGTSL